MNDRNLLAHPFDRGEIVGARGESRVACALRCNPAPVLRRHFLSADIQLVTTMMGARTYGSSSCSFRRKRWPSFATAYCIRQRMAETVPPSRPALNSGTGAPMIGEVSVVKVIGTATIWPPAAYSRPSSTLE